MQLDKLPAILEKEPKYRSRQAYQAIFASLASSWQDVPNLPLSLREKLDEACPLSIRSISSFSEDSSTRKELLDFQGAEVECVLLRHADRNTVCVSSQAGCALNCQFCATGRSGFQRDLEAGEIAAQVLFFARLLKTEGKRVTNVVFMGMGEPLLNYRNVLRAIKIINDHEGLNIGARKISVSTVGIPDAILRLAREPWQVNLAVSLHAPDDALRGQLMPIGLRYPIPAILDAVRSYIRTTGRKVLVEYLLLDGINDAPEMAQALGELLKRELTSLFTVNLIPYNQAGIANFRASSRKSVLAFRRILEEQGISVTERYRFGRDIGAACGQLRGRRHIAGN